MTNPKLFADLAELAGGAAQALSSIKKQLREETSTRMGAFADRFDLVTRDDVDRLEGMIAKLRTRVDALEKSRAGKSERKAQTQQKAAKKTAKSTRKTTSTRKKK